MATLEEVVDVLIKQTERGTVKWDPINWDNDGTPRRWTSAVENGCELDLMGRSATLNMLDNKRWITLGEGTQVERLVSAVALTANCKGTTRDEALERALSSLTASRP